MLSKIWSKFGKQKITYNRQTSDSQAIQIQH